MLLRKTSKSQQVPVKLQAMVRPETHQLIRVKAAELNLTFGEIIDLLARDHAKAKT